MTALTLPYGLVAGDHPDKNQDSLHLLYLPRSWTEDSER